MTQAPGPTARDGGRPARSGPLHWLATAAALAAVTAGVLAVRPDPGPGTGAAPAPRAGAAPASGRADPHRIPLDCGPVKITVVKRITADLDHDGRPDTVVAAHCAAGNGTPPDALYLYTPANRPDGRPVVLLDAAKGLTVGSLDLRGDRLHARLLGYSSPQVPRCCPDQSGEVEWRWEGGIFRLHGDEPAGGPTSEV